LQATKQSPERHELVKMKGHDKPMGISLGYADLKSHSANATRLEHHPQESHDVWVSVSPLVARVTPACSLLADNEVRMWVTLQQQMAVYYIVVQCPTDEVGLVRSSFGLVVKFTPLKTLTART
jgi:hypothetical protein